MQSARLPPLAASIVAGIAACALALAAVAAPAPGCSQFSGVESAEACTALIEKGGRTPDDLADLYLRRGEFYRVRGMLDLAFADFAEALRLLPGFLEARYDRGLAYRDANKLEEALADLNEAVRAEEKLGRRLARADVLEMLHENARALEDYNFVLAKAPDFLPAHLSRGEFWLRTGNPVRARLDFDRAITLKPDAANAFFGRASALRQTGDLGDAISDYARAIELAPDRPEYQAALEEAYKIKAHPELADAEQELLKQRRWAVPSGLSVAGEPGPRLSAPLPSANAFPPASTASQPAGSSAQWPPSGTGSPGSSPFDTAQYPNVASALALGVQAMAHAQKGQFSTALAELDQAIALSGQNANLYDARGSVLLRMAELARAKADIDRALSIDPTNLDAQAHAANLLDQQGEHAKAVAEFDRIIGINPQHIPSHIGKGVALLGLGQFERALAEFDRALAITPNPMQVDALVARGVALAAKGRRKEANANVERAMDLDPDNAKAVLGQALVLMLSRQLDRAITVLDRSIANGSEDPVMFVLRGKAFAQTGALDRAIADFDQALKFRPRDGEALTARGSVWMKKKDYVRALADLDQSIDTRPTVAAYIVRGLLHEMQGKCSLAMADYRQARELKPSDAAETQAQAAAKTRLDQYARRKTCAPGGERRLAGGGFGATL